MSTSGDPTAWAPQSALDRELDTVVQTWLDGSRPEESLALIEDGQALRPYVQQGRDQHGASVAGFRGRIDELTIEGDRAAIRFSLGKFGSLGLGGTGTLANIDGHWMVTRETECALLSQGGIICPPRS